MQINKGGQKNSIYCPRLPPIKIGSAGFIQTSHLCFWWIDEANEGQIGNILTWTWTRVSVDALNWQYFNFKNEKRKTEERNCYLRRGPKRDSNWFKILFMSEQYSNFKFSWKITLAMIHIKIYRWFFLLLFTFHGLRTVFLVKNGKFHPKSNIFKINICEFWSF